MAVSRAVSPFHRKIPGQRFQEFQTKGRFFPAKKKGGKQDGFWMNLVGFDTFFSLLQKMG